MGAGVAAGVVALAGVVVSVPGAGLVVLGVTTPGVGIAPGAGAAPGVVLAPVPVVCAPAAMVDSTVQATAKHAMAKKAPP